MCNMQEETFFSDIQQMTLQVIREEMRERHLVGTDRDSVPTCKSFVRSVVLCCLDFASCVLSV